MFNSTSVTTEKMDLSELFPDRAAGRESTMFQKNPDLITIDHLDKEKVLSDGDKKDDKTGVKTDDNKDIVKTDDNKVIVKADTPATTLPTKVLPSGPADLSDLDKTKEEFEEVKSGTKTDLVDFFKAKIEAGELITFDDYDEKKQTVEEYLKTFKKKDFDELWKSNITQKEQDMASALPRQFFDALPPELQYAARYYQDGGTDMKALFRALAQVVETGELDPKADARKINETYLSAKNFGTPEQIKEQLDEWEDLGVMEKKAAGFKPQLDQMEEEVLEQKLAQQARLKQQQQEQYNFYHDNVVAAIKSQDLGGITIDKKTQSALYSGLTQDTFNDSRGKRCTEFEYLLDQVMWAKPNYQLLAKVHWLLKDEAAFETALSTKKVNASTEATVRLLKTEQAKSSSAQMDSPESSKRRTIARPTTMFQR